MMVRGLVASLLVAAFATIAAAQPAGTSVMSSEAGQRDAAYTATLRPGQDPDERVCRSVTYSGSRLGGERVCHTRREWAELTQRARERTDDVVNAGLRNGCQSGPNGANCG